ncbi:type I secretion C-terminal target domain-containing protein [Massilia sp. B-10]|nr:type I secretion C-terminal target domain-containing protein [Massilia sp. B-10]
MQLSNLEGGLQDIELLYWEQGGNAVLRIEYKASSDPTSSYQVLSLTNTAMFSAEAAPTFSDPQIQDLVYDSGTATWQMRTGARLDGDASGNTLTGAAGRDLLSGNGGADTLYGYGGADRLDGGSGNDTLYGGDGNDVLIGGTGTDRLEGGLGDDIYILNDALDTLVEANNAEHRYGPARRGLRQRQLHADQPLREPDRDRVDQCQPDRQCVRQPDRGWQRQQCHQRPGRQRLPDRRRLSNDSLTGGAGSDTFAWRLADKGSSQAQRGMADTITDFTQGGGYSNIESGTLGVAVGGGDVLDLRDLLQGEHTSLGVTNPATASVAISNLQNYIHIEISGANTILHISSSGSFSGTSNTGEDQTITLSNVNLYSQLSITNGDDATLLRTLLKNGTLVVD